MELKHTSINAKQNITKKVIAFQPRTDRNQRPGANLTTQEQKQLNDHLLTAVLYGEIKKVRNLVDQGADVNTKEPNVGAPIIRASSHQGKRYLKILEFLVLNGADIESKKASGETALMIASKIGFSDAAKLLLHYGAATEAKNSDGKTALMLATSKRTNKNLETLSVLVQNGARIDARDHETRDVFMNAILNSNVEAVQFFIDNGADVHSRDENGHTPLLIASMRNRKSHIDIIKILLQNGADLLARNNKGSSALNFTRAGDLEMQQFLKRQLRKMQLTITVFDELEKFDVQLFLAAKTGDFVTINNLIKKKANVNVQDSSGMSPLMLATIKGKLKTVKVLIENGADVNLRDNIGNNAFRYAIDNNHLQTAAFLRKQGARW